MNGWAWLFAENSITRAAQKNAGAQHFIFMALLIVFQSSDVTSAKASCRFEIAQPLLGDTNISHFT
jgi:hypothetical protein